MSFLCFRRPSHPFVVSAIVALCLSACGGDGGNSGEDTSPVTVPAAPQGLGVVDSAPVADEAVTPPYVDNAATNQRGDARYATLATNAGMRVVSAGRRSG